MLVHPCHHASDQETRLSDVSSITRGRTVPNTVSLGKEQNSNFQVRFPLKHIAFAPSQSPRITSLTVTSQGQCFGD